MNAEGKPQMSANNTTGGKCEARPDQAWSDAGAEDLIWKYNFN